MTANQNLLNYIRRYIDLSDAEFEVFNSFLTKRELKKKAFLLREGHVCAARYYIAQGCVRLFYIDSKGNEQILHFGVDNWWISDYQSLVSGEPSEMFIQAIEQTQLLALDNTAFERLCAKMPKVERLFRIIMEKTCIALNKRIGYIFSLSGEEQYHTFISANPEFAQRVPQYMIASMLGLTPEFVSKVRGRRHKVIS